MKEIKECIAATDQTQEVPEKHQTRSQYEKAGTSTALEPGLELRSSPRKRVHVDDRKETGGKKPKKEDEHKETGGKGPKKNEDHKETGNKKPKTPEQQKEKDDKKTNDDDIDKLVNRPKALVKQTKKTSAIPLLRDDDDDDDLMIMDDEDKDWNYEPDDDDEEDNNDYPVVDDDDDDFQEPMPRARKTVKVTQPSKPSKKQATH